MTDKPHKPPAHAVLPSQLLRINDVVALTTLSKSCVNLWVAQGRFPKPIALSSTLKVWRCSDLSDWIDKHFETPEDADRAEQSTSTASVTRAEGESK